MRSLSTPASYRGFGSPARWAGRLAVSCVYFAAFGAQAALFDDDEARRAILDLRQKIDATQLRNADELRRANEETAQLRRSLIELSNQIEAARSESALMRGQNEKLARDVADIQRAQKEISQGVDERIRKFEPAKVTVDGRDFVADPAERQDFETALAQSAQKRFCRRPGWICCAD